MTISRRKLLLSLSALGCTTTLPRMTLAASLNLSQHQGKVVYLDFWASWCGPCLRSFPWLAQMHEAYGASGLEIIAVNVDRSREAADRFLTRVPAPFEIVYDPEGELAERYGVSGMPHSFLIDRAGKPLSNHIGFLESEKTTRESAIKTALAAKP